MSDTCELSYDSDTFKTIYDRCSPSELNATYPDVQKKIAAILRTVLSPTYKKNPVFEKRRSSCTIRHDRKGHGDAARNQNARNAHRTKSCAPSSHSHAAVTIAEGIVFDGLKKFKQSNTVHSDEQTNEAIARMQVILNKITDTTYKKLMAEVTQQLTCNVDYVNRFLERLLHVVHINSSNATIYAKMFLEVHHTHPSICMAALNSSIEKYLDSYQTIESTNPDADYDKYCEECQKNNQRRNITQFYCSLKINGILPEQKWLDIVEVLHQNTCATISLDNKDELVNELAHNLNTLLLDVPTTCASYITQTLIPRARELASGQERHTKSSLTQKCVFKYKDIVERYSTPTHARGIAR